MPLTFLSHQAPVLPLKMVAPRWFDGTALVIGSMIPDLAYLTQGSRFYINAHDAVAQLWFCLPVTVVITWIVKRVIAGPLGPHLPDLGPFHLRDFGRLAAWRPPRNALGILVLITSALIGTYSHIAMDSFTHGWGWVAQHVDFLRTEVAIPRTRLTDRPVPVYDFLQIGGTIVGAVITVWCLYIIGTRRMVTRWYPAEPPLQSTASSRRLVTGWAAGGAVAGLVLAVAMVHLGGDQSFIIRVADVMFVGLVIGCLAARRPMVAAAAEAVPASPPYVP